MEDTLTLTLTRQIVHVTVEHAELRLSEPTYAQLVKATKAGIALEQLGTLIHLNAKVPPGVVEQMTQRDLDRAADFFARFGNKSPTTSAT